MAVETFFHARPGSPLLRGITDDDFITWFDKTELASLQTTASIDNICECGRICSRDYEFKKNYNKSSDEPKNTGNSEEDATTITSQVTKAQITTPITSTTAPMTSTTTPITTTTSQITSITTMIVTTDKPNEDVTKILPLPTSTASSKAVEPETTTVTEITNFSDKLLSNSTTIEHTDDPIIIPTATYVNYSEAAKVDNNIVPIVPKHNGELIVQKILSKSLPKKDSTKKKPLPRRKGTLKATYGEKFIEKAKAVNSHVINPTKINKPIMINDTVITLIKIDTHTTDIPKTENKSNDIVKVINDTKSPNVVKEHKRIIKLETHHSTKELETSTIPHTITAITNSNIKNIHYRTKKPKELTQIKKPRIELNHTTETAKSHETDNHDTKINKTKMKNISTEKRTIKTLKSINKEIHKVPSTPISETSKILSEPVKPDIAPENKGGFEILDKNNLWELLKEGPDSDPSKIDDKLQVHNRINVIGHNLSNTTNDSRSL